MDFVEACYKEMVSKDPFAACMFALLKSNPNQRKAFRRWFVEEMKKAGATPGRERRSKNASYQVY